MSGFSTWPIRDIFFGIILIFNAGGFVYIMANHLRHVNQNLAEIFLRLGKIEQRVARIEGGLSKRTEGDDL